MRNLLKLHALRAMLPEDEDHCDHCRIAHRFLCEEIDLLKAKVSEEESFAMSMTFKLIFTKQLVAVGIEHLPGHVMAHLPANAKNVLAYNLAEITDALVTIMAIASPVEKEPGFIPSIIDSINLKIAEAFATGDAPHGLH